MARAARQFTRAVLLSSVAHAAMASGSPFAPPEMLDDLADLEEGAPAALAIAGNSVLFAGPNDAGSHAVWRFEGGTFSNLGPPCDSPAGNPYSFHQLPGSRALYQTDGCELGFTEIWSLDLATLDKSRIEKPLVGVFPAAERMWRIGHRAFLFYQPGDLWVSDGTNDGTEFVASPGWIEGEMAQLRGLGVFKASGGGQYRPWVTDGSNSGTNALADVYPERIPGSSKEFFQVGELLLFLGYSLEDGHELWSTDGTHQGTKRISNLRPGTENPNVSDLIVCGGVAYFASRGLAPEGAEIGVELWRSDGSKKGTHLVADLAAGADGSYPYPLGCLGPKVVFIASTSLDDPAFWLSDGTADGTGPFAPFSGLAAPTQGLEFHGWLFFVLTTAGEGDELWATNGTEEATFLVQDLRAGEFGSTPLELTPFGNSLLFTADDGVHGREIWRLVVDSNLVFRSNFDSGTPSDWGEP